MFDCAHSDENVRHFYCSRNAGMKDRPGVARRGRHILRLSSSAAVIFCLAQPAWAQVSPPSPSSQPVAQPAIDTVNSTVTEAREIVVTASRAAATGFDSPTPTTVISNEALARQAQPNVGAVLVSNPAFKPVLNPSSGGLRTQNPSQATADLRGLGAQRTLVLFDGMRVVPVAAVVVGSAGVAPDLNRIPSLMIERVEVVTGGASAQWGSDAVAGVVNILLKKEFQGATLRVTGGVSQRGDAANFNPSALAGTSFADGRGHVIVGVDYFHSAERGDIYTRAWGRNEVSLFTNPSPLKNGLPALIVSPNVHSSNAPGGLITGPGSFAMSGYEFTPGGALSKFNYGSPVSGANMIGGEGASFAKGQSLAPGVDRFSSFARVEYEITSNIRAYIEGGYSYSKGSLTYQPSQTTQTIQNYNPYLPTAVSAAMATAGISSFTLSRINYDLGPTLIRVKNEVGQGAIGLQGKLGGGWSWDVHYTYGRNDYRNEASNNLISQRIGFATDAVLSGGQIVCNATLPGPKFNAAAAGCVPINLFGAGAPSAQAKAYVEGISNQHAIYNLSNAAFNIQGKPFSTWAGEVGVGAGLEYRRESINATADSIGQVNGFAVTGNAAPYSGSFDVKEGYLEAVVPLAKDIPALYRLDANAAVRYADYNLFGGRTTWKVGGTYEPINGIRFRVTRSRDLRAPALYELFSPGGNITQTVNVRGFSAVIPSNISKGNPNLKPEIANTLTAGIVLEPKGSFSGLKFSVDYFNIKLTQAVTNFANAAQGLCTAGNALACSFFTFDPNTGAPVSFTTPTVNAASLRYMGYDFGLSYRRRLGSLIGNQPNTVEVAFNGSYLQHAYIDLGIGTGPIDRAGENSALNNGANPYFTGTATATYSSGASSLSAQFRYISSGVLDKTFNTTVANTINNNNVPAALYVNLFGTLALDRDGRKSIFLEIDNLMDKDPPIAPFPALNSPTNPQYYDTVGRAFRLGATVKF